MLGFKVFTFQYGSNQMIPIGIAFKIISVFTFQYGSNQITYNVFKEANKKRFTFQYGSNQIRYILNLAIATYTDILFVYLQINIYFPK